VHRVFKSLKVFLSPWGCVLLALGLALAAEAQTPQVNISVYNDAHVPSDILARAESRAAAIFWHAGLGLNWVNCDPSALAPSDPSCSKLDGPEHFVLRIIPHGSGSNPDARFGVTFLGPGGIGRYSDVFWDKAQELHTNTQVDISTILGSVMAHEMGHLTLGSHAHAINGIMRARWEGNELQRIVMGTLLFLPGQEKQMRNRYSSQPLVSTELKLMGQ
jgi:hypothetical protein